MNHHSGRHPGGVRPWRTAAAIAAMAVTGLLAAACGGGGSHPSGSGASSSRSLAVVLDPYASCMRSHGVPNFYFTHLTAPPGAPPPGEFVMGFHGWFAEADFNAQISGRHRGVPAPAAVRERAGHRDPSGVPQRGQGCGVHAVARVPELARSESERRGRLGAGGRRYEVAAVRVRGEDLPRARATQRVTRPQDQQANRPTPDEG